MLSVQSQGKPASPGAPNGQSNKPGTESPGSSANPFSQVCSAFPSLRSSPRNEVMHLTDLHSYNPLHGIGMHSKFLHALHASVFGT